MVLQLQLKNSKPAHSSIQGEINDFTHADEKRFLARQTNKTCTTT